MKTILTIAVIFAASGASATEYCLVKRTGGEAVSCFKTKGQCETKADRMNGWNCEKR